MVFPAVPENLRDKPTLLLLLHSPEAGKHKLELSYLTGGLSWRADYVAALNEDDSKLDLNGLVTLTNQSGVTYPQARLQLVAGDVNRIQSEQRMGRKMAAMSAEMADVAQMKEESFSSTIFIHFSGRRHLPRIKPNKWRSCLLVRFQSIKCFYFKARIIIILENMGYLAKSSKQVC